MSNTVQVHGLRRRSWHRLGAPDPVSIHPYPAPASIDHVSEQHLFSRVEHRTGPGRRSRSQRQPLSDGARAARRLDGETCAWTCVTTCCSEASAGAGCSRVLPGSVKTGMCSTCALRGRRSPVSCSPLQAKLR